MVAVFGAFVLSGDVVIKLIGVGLASAILIDATIVRMVLVPGGDAAARRSQLVAAALAGPGGAATWSWSPHRRGRPADGGGTGDGVSAVRAHPVPRRRPPFPLPSSVFRPPAHQSAASGFLCRQNPLQEALHADPRPSPGTVIATVALVMATTGTAVAAVDFLATPAASTASAPSAPARRTTARRATWSPPPAAARTRARSRNKFLADVAGRQQLRAARSPSRTTRPARPSTWSANPFGRISISCQDQAGGAGTEDPRMVLSFTNTSGGAGQHLPPRRRR